MIILIFYIYLSRNYKKNKKINTRHIKRLKYEEKIKNTIEKQGEYT